MTEALGELVGDVTNRAGRLEGPAEAAAVLESIGVDDDRARGMGRDGVLRLAIDIAEYQRGAPEAVERWSAVETGLREERARPHSRRALGGSRIRMVLRGLASAAPLTAPLGAALLLTGSLWTGPGTDIPRATAIALGIVASFVATSAFAYVASGRIRADLGRRAPLLALRSGLRLAAVGVVGSAVAGLALWGILEWKPLVAPDQIGTALQYFALLAALWLPAAMLSGRGRDVWFVLAVASGVAAGALVRGPGHASLVAAHRSGILVAAGASIAAAVALLFRDEIREMPRRSGPWSSDRLPLGDVARRLVPFALYGLALAGFLFADRLAAWYSQRPFHEWILGFQPDYEAGWDWALAAVLPGIVVVRSSAERFGGLLRSLSYRYPVSAERELSAELRASYRRSVSRLAVACVVGAVLTFLAMVWLIVSLPSVDRVVTKHSAYVFAMAGPALFLVLWSLLNVAVLFDLARLRAAVWGAWLAVVADLAVALPLTAHVRAWWAVFGLVAGAVVLWLVTTVAVRRIIHRPEFALARA
ncbi:MAG TPA: hypothetical protein VGB19_09550 [Actinomycetota bacterium]